MFPIPPAAVFTDANGELVFQFNLPVGPFNVTATFFWIYVDSNALTFQLSTGMTINL